MSTMQYALSRPETDNIRTGKAHYQNKGVDKKMNPIDDLFAKHLAERVCDADIPRPRPYVPLEIANSAPIESDLHWWLHRAWVLGKDLDKMGFDLSMGQRIGLRNN